MDIKDFPLPANIEDMKKLLEQFAPFISQDKYQLINDVLLKLQSEDGIKNDTNGQEILLKVLGLLNDPPYQEYKRNALRFLRRTS